MKKTLLAAMAFAAVLGAAAQTPITPVEGPEERYFAVIPRQFANNSYACERIFNDEYDRCDSIRIINSNLQVERTFALDLGVDNQGNAVREPERIEYYNFDAEVPSDDEYHLFCSQTLFNDDSKFEYIRRVYASNPLSDDYYQIERYEIVADDGTVVNTITWEEGYYISDDLFLYKFGNNYYLAVRLYNGETRKTAWYRLDRPTQSISRVHDVPFNVFPTVAERGSDITVQLDEGTNAREIVVVDAMGREVKSLPVAPGQREVKVSTSGLGAGMGFVSDRKHGAVKIIVR